MQDESRGCERCGVSIEGTDPKRRFCSTKCYNKAYAEKHFRCVDCGGPVYFQHAKRCQACFGLTQREASSANFKGAEATVNAQRGRARTAYALGPCEYEGCDKPAKDRHHIDGDTNNNEPENIQQLCRKHHLVVDGRLERLAEVAKRPRGPDLKWADVIAIRASTLTGAELARKYNKGIGTISAIWQNRTWHDPNYQPITAGQRNLRHKSREAQAKIDAARKALL